MKRASNLQTEQGPAVDPVDPAEVVHLDAALLAITHFFGSREVRGAVESSGVPPSYRLHFTALRAIRDLPQPVSIKDVQGELGLSHPATCRAIDRCVEDGLVDRQASTLDRRQMVLTLTRAGETAAVAVEEARQNVVAALIENWDEAERRDLLAWLERLKPELTRFRVNYAGVKASD